VAFTDEELQAAVAEGLSQRKIAERFGCDRDVIRRRLRLQASGEAPAPVVRPIVQRPRLSSAVDIVAQPFAVPIPRAAPTKSDNGYRYAVWWSDTHMGYEDSRALDVVFGVIKDVRPSLLIHGGDLCDAYHISKFDKNPERIHNLQDEIDRARVHLHQAAQLAPSARRVLLEGNHEDRLRRLIWTLPGTASELSRLRAFKAAMTWPNLLGLEEIGWDFVPANRQPLVGVIPKLALKHGEVVRKDSAMTARAEYGKYTMSGISGHTHRLGKYYHRDLRDSHVWIEGGCTCRIIDVEYATHPDWQQGCVVVTYKDDGSWFNAQEVYIESGRAMWGAREFAA
jgi:hypothetical protein